MTQSRWDKVKRILREFTRLYAQECVNAKSDKKPEVWLPHVVMESGHGFLIYITRRTYTTMIPYLKGLYLTIDSWQPNRDADGWKLPAAPGAMWSVDDTPKEAPAMVRAVGRLERDLRAHEMLMQSPHLPSILVRPTTISCATSIFLGCIGDQVQTISLAPRRRRN